MRCISVLTTIALIGLLPPGAVAQQGGVGALEARLTALEGQVATLENDLASANGEINSLQSQLAGLEGEVATLQGDLASANGEISSLQDGLSVAEDRIAALEAGASNGDLTALMGRVEVIEQELLTNTVLDLHGYLFLDGSNPQRPVALFEGINVQITNGETADLDGQQTPNGLGNLIVGFDLPRPPETAPVCSNGDHNTPASCAVAGEIWAENHKSGSHNLIVGPRNAYSQTGGVIFGEGDAVNRRGATVTGGLNNRATGMFSSVSAGEGHHARGFWSSVSGGRANIAEGDFSSISGGAGNRTLGGASSISGGDRNSANSTFSSVSGGLQRVATGDHNWRAGSLSEPN